MGLLPKRPQLSAVLFCHTKNPSHLATFGIGRANRIGTFRFSRGAIRKHVDNHLNPSVAAMYMRRRMVV